ncbi:MAG: hypothetical protein NC230_06375 [Bacteroides sp.]|nr:hypothetical protein [Bacteroides sp.]MCM1414278.1 hypothetical protein [Bacteroides sp.]
MPRVLTDTHRLLILLVIVASCAVTTAAEKRYIDQLPKRSVRIEPFSVDSLKALMTEVPLHRIEGLWRFPANGTEIAIVRTDIERWRQNQQAAPVYQIIVVTSENRWIRPGTLMGLITPGAKEGEYNARMYTTTIGSTLAMSKRFDLTLANEDTSLLIKKRKSAFSINLWRLLPYLWRYTIHPNTQNHDDDGCVRTFPESTHTREPIYL